MGNKNQMNKLDSEKAGNNSFCYLCRTSLGPCYDWSTILVLSSPNFTKFDLKKFWLANILAVS